MTAEEVLADRVVAAGRRRRRRRSTVIVGGLLAAAIAVAVPMLVVASGRVTADVAAAGTNAPARAGGASSPVSDRAAIYAAALRAHWAPSTPSAAFVRDQVCTTVISKPMSQCADSPIPMSVRREVARLLPFPVHFLAQRWGPQTGQVTSLIVFGTMSVAGDRATLAIEIFCGPMCGEGKTLVLARTNEIWRVTGTTGREWIT